MPGAEVVRDVLRRVAQLLAAWPHPSAIIGGIAITARVRPRLTDDIDLIITVPAGSLEALLSVARSHGFVEEDGPLARELAEAGLLRLWSSQDVDRFGVDLIFVDSEQLERAAQRATTVDMGFCQLPVASLEDLLLLKLEANRPQDIDDILAIKHAHLEALDMDYVRAGAERLGLAALLATYFSPLHPRE